MELFQGADLSFDIIFFKWRIVSSAQSRIDKCIIYFQLNTQTVGAPAPLK